MDVRLRWTLIGAGALATLIAVAVLPPRACSPDDQSIVRNLMCPGGWWGNRYLHARVAQRTRVRTAAALERRALADTLLVRAAGPRTQRSAAGITVVFDQPLTVDSARRWLARAERELALLPPGGPGAEVVLYLADTRPASLVTAKLRRDSTSIYYQVPARFAAVGGDGVTRCFVAVNVASRGSATMMRGGVLDWCALYARYGVPGPGVARWVRETFRWQWRWGGSFADEVAAAGRTVYRRTEEPYLWRACAQGATAPCRNLIGDEALGEGGWSATERRRAFMAWTVATAGGERFGRFWRSPGTLEAALEAGLGQPEAAVVGGWVRATVRVGEPPAGTRPRALLASALWASLALTAAFVAMYRRRTD